MPKKMIRSYVSKSGTVYAEALCYLVMDICGTFNNPKEPASAVKMIGLDGKIEYGENEPVRQSQLRMYPFCQDCGGIGKWAEGSLMYFCPDCSGTGKNSRRRRIRKCCGLVI